MFEGFETLDVKTKGVRIHGRHGGNGPPLLLLHGNPMTHGTWHKLVPELSQHFHVVATDLRGYGDSYGKPKLRSALTVSPSVIISLSLKVVASSGSE